MTPQCHSGFYKLTAGLIKLKKDTKSDGKTSQGTSGATDDALVTAEVAGTKNVRFGLAIDSIGRSTPSHMISFHVRRALMDHRAGMPWYEADHTKKSVANLLTVNTTDAEEFGAGLSSGNVNNTFRNYTDVPMNAAILDRLAFWRHEQAAAEFDPAMQFEAQVFAVENLSQLFVECFDFHFHFLKVLDDEYHRLRTDGAIGVMADDSNLLSPWYNMYHYWRGRVQAAYLDSGQVVLPAGLANSNWTINDVLSELYTQMTDSSGNFKSDIFLSEKGATHAKGGASLGILDTPECTDSDGNVRFYMPAWHVDGTFISGSAKSPYLDLNWSDLGSDLTGDDNQRILVGNDTVRAVGATATLLDNQLETPDYAGILDWIKDLSIHPEWMEGYTIDSRDADLTHLNPTSFLQSLPDGDKNGTDHSKSEIKGSKYWRGYQLNLHELINYMRKVGRELEPEVAGGFLPAFGLVSSPQMLMGYPKGLTARRYDQLANLYTSAFSYKENPARTYSAAHLGPIDQVIADDPVNGVSIGGITLKTDPNKTVRQQFWQPDDLDNSEISNILSHFMPGGLYEGTMLGPIKFSGTGTDAISSRVDNALVARLFGNKASMLTKVEKPVVLPAGVSEPEAVYASGMGLGGMQLIEEMLYSSLIGSPMFGLGHNGFSDWQHSPLMEDYYINTAGVDAKFVTRWPATREELGGLASMSLTAVAAKNADPSDVAKRMLGNNIADDFVELAGLKSNEGVSEDETKKDAQQIVFEMSKASLLPTIALNSFGAHNSDGVATQGFGNITQAATDSWSGLSLSHKSSEELIETKNISMNAVPGNSIWGMFTATEAQAASPMEGANASGVIVDDAVVAAKASSAFDIWVVPKTITFMSELGTATSNSTAGVTHSVDVDTIPGIAGFTHSDKHWSAALESNDQQVWPVLTGSGIKPYVRAHSTILKCPKLSPLDFIHQAFMYAMENNPDELSSVMDVSTLNGSKLFVKLDGTIACSDYGQGDSITAKSDREGTFGHKYELTWGDTPAGSFAGKFAANEIEVSASRTGVDGVSDTYGGQVKYLSYSLLKYKGSYSSTAVANHNSDYLDKSYLTGWTMPVDADAELCVSHFIAGEVTAPKNVSATAWNSATWKFYADGKALAETFTCPGGTVAPITVSTTNWSAGDTTTSWVLDGAQSNDYQIWANAIPSFRTVVYNGGTSSWEQTAGTEFGLLKYDQSNATTYANGKYGKDDGQNGHYRISTVLNLLDPINLNNGGSVSYVIPDDPSVRMVYRPYRNLVDAAMARELKLLLVPTHEQTSGKGGIFGLPYYGKPTDFRLAQLVFDANKPDQYVLEKATTKSRLLDPSNRGMLTFTKLTLLDPTSQRHVLLDVLDLLNDIQYTRGMSHAMSASGNEIYNKDLIREVQLGRQFIRLGN